MLSRIAGPAPRPAAPPPRPASARHVPEDQDGPDDPPAGSRIGAALSSMGRSVPSLAIRTVWLASPTIDALPQRPQAGFSTARRVCSLTMRNTVAAAGPPPRPTSSPSAPRRPGSANVTRPSASVMRTASPMLARVIRNCSRCRTASSASASARRLRPASPRRAGRCRGRRPGRGPARPGSRRPWTARPPRGGRRKRGRGDAPRPGRQQGGATPP